MDNSALYGGPVLATCVWLTIIMTSVSLHRAQNLQAVERLAQSLGYDESKLGQDHGSPKLLMILVF
jgi:hypothetical protein